MDTNSNERPVTAVSADARRAYSAPRLVQYGDVRELTEAGTGSLSEGSAMVAMMRFP